MFGARARAWAAQEILPAAMLVDQLESEYLAAREALRRL
jgi:nitronate monooxygenase